MLQREAKYLCNVQEIDHANSRELQSHRRGNGLCLALGHWVIDDLWELRQQHTYQLSSDPAQRARDVGVDIPAE